MDSSIGIYRILTYIFSHNVFNLLSKNEIHVLISVTLTEASSLFRVEYQLHMFYHRMCPE